MSTEIKERRPPIDTAAAATYTGTNPNYLEKLRCNGDGPVFIKRNGFVRYDPDDLDAWLEAGKRTSTSDEAPRDAGTLYDVVDGRRRWARIDGDQIKAMGYHGSKPEYDDGTICVPVLHGDSEPFNLATHWRLKPQAKIVYEHDAPVRVVVVYPVVEKSMELA